MEVDLTRELVWILLFSLVKFLVEVDLARELVWILLLSLVKFNVLVCMAWVGKTLYLAVHKP